MFTTHKCIELCYQETQSSHHLPNIKCPVDGYTLVHHHYMSPETSSSPKIYIYISSHFFSDLFSPNKQRIRPLIHANAALSSRNQNKNKNKKIELRTIKKEVLTTDLNVIATHLQRKQFNLFEEKISRLN